MFWEKKEKEKGLPDLPRPPTRTTLPQGYPPMHEEEDDKIHGLPAFPDSPMQRGFSQSAIKDAVANEDIRDELPDFKQAPKYNLVEMEEWNAQNRIAQPTPSARRENKPIFVRVDKFQLARNSLETVKVKLSEIEDLLKTIRDVKTKEDAELSSWESEMENIKSRVQSVLNDIFERAEA